MSSPDDVGSRHGATHETTVSGRGEATRATRSFDTAQLFGAETEIEIIHHETVYRLKITRQGKLILNK